MDDRKEANCNHDLAYLLMEGDRDNVGRCVQCDEEVNLKVGYVKHPHLRYEADGQYNPVYKKSILDQVYVILTRLGADIGALSRFVEENYGTADVDEKTGIFTVRCTEEAGKRLHADHKGRTKGSVPDSIMVLSKLGGEG